MVLFSFWYILKHNLVYLLFVELVTILVDTDALGFFPVVSL